MNFDNLCFLVSSFDKYAPCWEPFCHGLKKYWPDHPARVYFITNSLDSPCGEAIKSGEDRGWARNLKMALEQINCEIVLYAQEDYWIKAPVNSQHIEDYTQLIRLGRADYIRLYPAPGPNLPFDEDERLGILTPDAPYRTSLQMALWRKSALLGLLDLAESPWQFEVKSPTRSRDSASRFLCVTRKKYGIDYTFTAIVNGYWSKQALEYAERESITVRFEELEQQSLERRMSHFAKAKAYRLKKRLAILYREYLGKKGVV